MSKDLIIRSSSAEFLIFERQKGEKGIEVRFEDGDLWLTQKAISDLFDTSKQDVSYHLKNIFNTLELEENSVVKKYLTTANDNKKYNTNYYNLDAVISIGFRVNSDKAIQFRRWSINVLKEFAKKGYIIDKKRMENGIFFDEDYFESLLAEIREIRLSERRFYQKIFEKNNNLHILSGNALNMDDYIKCEEYYDSSKELAIINEGLLRYLTFDEKRTVGQNIYNMLKKHGGVWITCDVTPKKFIQKQDEQNPTLNNSLNTVTSRNNLNDRFEDENHIREFFGEIGFKNIEIHKFIEVKDELKSFNILGIDRNLCDELLESALVAILKI